MPTEILQYKKSIKIIINTTAAAAEIIDNESKILSPFLKLNILLRKIIPFYLSFALRKIILMK